MIKLQGIAAWTEVRRELDRWADNGLTAKFWVRDDDAIQVSADLERLHDFATRRGVQIGLAVIPGKALPDLVEFLADSRREFYPMCHGWQHVNHSRGNKPAEFGPDRPTARLIMDARSALNAFSGLFRSAKAIFVPPFNGATAALVRALPNIGYFGVSLMPSRLERTLLQLSFGLNWLPVVKIPDFSNSPRIDVHLDVINWKTMKAQDAEIIVNQLLQHLRGRRLGLLTADAPIGLLTHHLVHNEGIWSRCEEILDVLQSHDTVKFVDVGRWADEYFLKPAASLSVRTGRPL
jgi:hypothetical protein